MWQQRRGLFVVHVAQDERGAILPSETSQRVDIRNQMDVAVTFAPVCQGISRDGLHFHIDRQQIIASVGPRFGDGV